MKIQLMCKSMVVNVIYFLHHNFLYLTSSKQLNTNYFWFSNSFTTWTIVIYSLSLLLSSKYTTFRFNQLIYTILSKQKAGSEHIGCAIIKTKTAWKELF